MGSSMISRSEFPTDFLTGATWLRVKELEGQQESLLKSGVIGQRDYDVAQTAYRTAEARYNQAAAQLNQAVFSEQSASGAGIAQAVLLEGSRLGRVG